MRPILVALALFLAACGSPSSASRAPEPQPRPAPAQLRPAPPSPPPTPPAPPPECNADADCTLVEESGACKAVPTSHAPPTTTPPVGGPSGACWGYAPRCDVPTHHCVAMSVPIS